MSGKTAPAGSDAVVDCVTCGAGKYAAAGSATCTDCPAGKTAPAGSDSVVDCVACAAGKFSASFTAAGPLQGYDQRLDMAGKYAPAGSACLDCAAGIYGLGFRVCGLGFRD